MLVLTRKVGQVITLGSPHSPEKAIEIKVVEVQGSDVKLGFEAPGDVPIHRLEIWEQRQQEKVAAEVQGAE